MWNAVKMQIHVLFRRKSAIVMYFLMYALISLNFYENVSEYHGYNIYNMFNPLKLLLLSYYGKWGWYFAQYYPLLVVILAAFSYYADISSREIVFIQTRMDRKTYYISKMIATFLVTFIIFTVPLLVEILLNSIAIPTEAVGDPSNAEVFNLIYNEAVNYLFCKLWFLNQYIYVIFMIVLFGILSGCLACFSASLSMYGFCKFRVFIFLPVYVLLYVLTDLGNIVTIDIETNYFFYIRLFKGGEAGLSETAYVLFVLGLVCVTGALVYNKMKKDQLD